MADEVDAKILKMLKHNSRAHNVKIAREVGLTEGAVRKRIEHLVEKGIIKKFTVEVSGEHHVFAIVMVKAKGETKRMMKGILHLGITSGAYEISGDYDACLVIDGANVNEIDGKIDSIRGLESVSDTKTFISLKKW